MEIEMEKFLEVLKQKYPSFFEDKRAEDVVRLSFEAGHIQGLKESLKNFKKAVGMSVN